MTDSQKIDLLLNKIDFMGEEMSNMKEDMSNMKEKVSQIDEKVEKLDQRVEKLDQRVEKIDKRVKSVELSMENELTRNIKIIAEGHLNLNRKLDEALKVENEKELLLIRVNILENEVRLIKDKIPLIASS